MGVKVFFYSSSTSAVPLTLEFIDPRPKTRRFTKWKIQSLGQINPIKNFSRGLTEKSVIQEKMGEEGERETGVGSDRSYWFNIFILIISEAILPFHR